MTSTSGPEWSEQQRAGEPQPHGTAPTPAHVEPPGSPVAPPREVRTAFWLWIASFVLALLAVGIIYFGTIGDLSGAAFVAARNSPFTFPGVDLEGLIRYVIYIGLLLFFAFKMRLGKNWARVTLTILAVFEVSKVPLEIGIAVGADSLFILYVVLSSLQAVLVVVAIVFIFLSNANRYFRSARGNR